MLWDTHMHCYFSGDSEASPQEMIFAASKKKLDGICFTDHLDLDYKEEPGLFDLDIPAYYKEISELRQSSLLPVRWGIEIGLQPHLTDINNEIIHKYPFDFVIGSSHVVNGADPYYPSYFQGRDDRAAFTEYFESILENLKNPVDFDVYGHLDYIVRYSPNKAANYTYPAYADVIDEILRRLIHLGKGIEVNTAGLRAGLGQPNPAADIIKRYRELGGEIITLGADAHMPEHVAYAFDKLPVLLKEAGFSYYTVFNLRKPEFRKI